MKKLVLAGLMMLVAWPGLAETRILNGDDPGATVDIEKNLQPGRTSIVYFYADW